MIDLERRLHHAARELREIEIEPPPLVALPVAPNPSRLMARAPALVLPVLFALCGLAIIAGGGERHTEEGAVELPPATVPVAVDETPGAPTAPTPPALTVHQELALIASLATSPAAPPSPDADARSTDARATAAPLNGAVPRRYR